MFYDYTILSFYRGGPAFGGPGFGQRSETAMVIGYASTPAEH